MRAAQRAGVNLKGSKAYIVRNAVPPEVGADLGRQHCLSSYDRADSALWRKSRPCWWCMRLLQYVGCSSIVYTWGPGCILQEQI